MTAGRPPGNTLDPAIKGSVVEAYVSVGTRGRSQLPSHIASQAQWTKGQDGYEVLAILDPGVVTLRPWNPHGAAVLEKRKELIDAVDASLVETLRMLEARYKKLNVLADFRVTLPPEILLHLGLNPKSESGLFAYFLQDRLELVSHAFHASLLDKAATELADLP